MQSTISDQANQALKQIASQDLKNGIKIKFEEDADRIKKYGVQLGSLFFDFSKTHISDELLDIYSDIAGDVGVHDLRKAFLSGDQINNTEQRSVLHTLLRDIDNQGIAMLDDSVLQQASKAKSQFAAQFEQIASSLAQRGTPIENIIHVGIGGSSLGTQLLYEALKSLEDRRKIHFVGNIDGHQMVDVLNQCQVNNTLVIGVSKTFTTAETLQNLNSISDWFKQHNVDNPLDHFYGITANPDAALGYGLTADHVVTFPEWVGGRYSVWSSVSLSAALLLGKAKFEQFLNGAAQVDQHFYQADLKKNVCFQAAALDHYYTNYLGVSSKAIFAYDFRFRSLVEYLQQLETESNGKDRQKDGRPVDVKTSMVVWGGVGTDVQHSVFQMLHQGTSMIPAEFILVKCADHNLTEHHNELLANGIAQTAALLSGQDLATVTAQHADENLSDVALKAKIFSGNRPSMTLLLDALTPAALGELLAFYEHRVFFGGALAHINSFDQMGVELGKRLAKQVRPYVDGQALTGDEFDPSTRRLLAQLKTKEPLQKS